MRVLMLDIDTLRPDHLGCYGYHRATSPNIDHVARQGIRFENVYVSDAPCLPSRTALWSGRNGFHTGIINHGGVAADPFIEGASRGFRDVYDRTGWIPEIARAGLHPVTVSPFGERHSAWWWYAGYREMYNPGQGGLELADSVTPLALDWIRRNARKDNWFLHVNYWDPHTPYRTPAEFGNPFKGDAIPGWLTEEVRQHCWNSFGPHGAQEPYGYGTDEYDEWIPQEFPNLPASLSTMDSVKTWIDGYDTGIRYADEHIGRLMNALADEGVLDDLVIIITSDHGENQGELNVWGDHQTADHITCRVPLIIRWPGLSEGRVDSALHYHYDWGATLLEMLGREVPENWDAQPFTHALQTGQDQGRDDLVISQGAWACQRSVRFRHENQDYLCMRTYHDGYKMLEPLMLFNLTNDPHEQNDLYSSQPGLVDQAMRRLTNWQQEMMLTSRTNIDPMMTVLREGGAFHTRGCLPAYLRRLRATGRADHADRLARLHPDEAGD